MKKTSILLSLACAFLYLILSSYSSGPGSSGLELTGVTGTVGCGGSGCHSSTSPNPWLSVTMTLQNSLGYTVPYYLPGDTCVLHIHGVNYSPYILPQFGYQATARLAWPINAGMFIAPTGSHLDTVSGVRICEHSAPISGIGSGGYGTTYDVYIKWVAPPTGSGAVTFRDVLIAVNDTASGTIPFDMWNTGAAPLVIAEFIAPMPIVGQPKICQGNTTTLSDPVSGGTWISLNPTVATVGGTTGIVTGISPGTAVINYNLPFSGTDIIVTVNPMPASISGPTFICTGSSILLTDITPGGGWGNSDPTIASVDGTGIVTGVDSGTAFISYTLPSGCATGKAVEVGDMPLITGASAACIGSTISMDNIAPGGTWTSSAPGIAAIDSSGTVTAVAAGVATITYATSTACAATKTVTISAVPSAAIAGTPTVCEGATTTLIGTPGGGTWISTRIDTASVSAAGVVSGISGGTTTILYIASNSCGIDTATTPLLVIPTIICEMGVGGPASAQKPIAVYPNPSNGQCTVHTNIAGTGKVSMRVVNAMGQVVSQWRMPANGMLQIQLPTVPGLYLLSADAGDLHYTTKIEVE